MTSDLLEYSNLAGYLVTIDIEKAFDSVDHTFLCATLRKFGFGENYIKWIQILLKGQESCVMNNGFTTKYFSLSSGTRQGDPLSAYLFILVMEILFIQIRNNKNIRGLRIFGYEFRLTSFADDVYCFYIMLTPLRISFTIAEKSYFFNSLKINYEKSEVWHWLKERAVGTFSDLSSIDLTTQSIKILGCHHSYNKQLAEKRNFLGVISDMQNILSLWSMRGLSFLAH